MAKSSDSSLTIARYSLMQAIIVALVTATGGFLTAKITMAPQPQGNASNSHEQHWLVIEGIEGQGHEYVRITATVNGINYSYPTNTVWAKTGPLMSGESFPLPFEEETYRISFTAFSRLGSSLSTKHLGSRIRDEIKPSQLPVEKKFYSLFETGPSSNIPVPEMKVFFSIR